MIQSDKVTKYKLYIRIIQNSLVYNKSSDNTNEAPSFTPRIATRKMSYNITRRDYLVIRRRRYNSLIILYVTTQSCTIVTLELSLAMSISDTSLNTYYSFQKFYNCIIISNLSQPLSFITNDTLCL